jgi:hypothetical protein
MLQWPIDWDEPTHPELELVRESGKGDVRLRSVRLWANCADCGAEVHHAAVFASWVAGPHSS